MRHHLVRRHNDFEFKFNMKALTAYAKMGLSIIAMLVSIAGFLSDKDNLVVKGIGKIIELATRKPEKAEQAQKQVTAFVKQHKQEIPPEQIQRIQNQMAKMVDIAREINKKRMMAVNQESVERALNRSAEIANGIGKQSTSTPIRNNPVPTAEERKKAMERMRLAREKAFEQMRLIRMKQTSDSIRRRRRRRDIAPAIMMALKVVGPMLGNAVAGQVAGAVGDFARQKVLDPAFEATRESAIRKLRQYEATRGRNETHSARLLRGAREETEKLKKMAQRERLPIANLLHATVQGLRAEEMNMLRDSRAKRRRDSRLKRSTKRPGRATSWEIKMAMGMNEGAILDPNYVGHVNTRGDVIVMHKLKPNKIAAEISGNDLDRLALMSKNGMLKAGLDVGQWLGRSTDLDLRARIQQKNEQSVKSAASKVASAAATAASALDVVEKISEGLSSTINGARKAGENIKNALNSFNAAKADLREA